VRWAQWVGTVGYGGHGGHGGLGGGRARRAQGDRGYGGCSGEWKGARRGMRKCVWCLASLGSSSKIPSLADDMLEEKQRT
jgi:hypothetical protein